LQKFLADILPSTVLLTDSSVDRRMTSRCVYFPPGQHFVIQ